MSPRKVLLKVPDDVDHEAHFNHDRIRCCEFEYKSYKDSFIQRNTYGVVKLPRNDPYDQDWKRASPDMYAESVPCLRSIFSS